MSRKQCALCGKEEGRFALPITVRAHKHTFTRIAEKNNSTEILAELLPETLPADGRICRDCSMEISDQLRDPYPEERERLEEEAQERIEEYEKYLDKNAIIQFKNGRIAILKRTAGELVQFIIAYDDLTLEGYRCVAQDEGKEGNLAGGTSSYFYFQKIKCASCNTD